MTDTPSENRPRMPATPPEALGPSRREQVFIDDRVFLLDRPSESDRMLNHPQVMETFAFDEYIPYWADLWPAARMLAKWIFRQPAWPGGLQALEIGCGLGLPGIVALSRGVRVTFSDYDATALDYAANNARLNGFSDFDTLQIDWRYPPRERKYPLLLAADLIYEARNVEPLVGLIRDLLAPTGVCLLTDQDRVSSHILKQQLEREGLPFTTSVMRAGEPGGHRVKGTIYRIRHAGGQDPLPIATE